MDQPIDCYSHWAYTFSNNSVTPHAMGLMAQLESSDYNTILATRANQEQKPRVIEQPITHIFHNHISMQLLGAGIVGLTAWLLCTRFSSDAPALSSA